mmetsp:Transcript_16626/g.21817  ORF Transcript_16626/g.21817 Transcript_16626/m.21817 type:complete len:261 (-) Transcript_16626:224-1006(-)
MKGERLAWAPHYYDALTLLTKIGNPWAVLDIETEGIALGIEGAENAIKKNLEHVKHTSTTLGGNPGVPTLVGEIGIPFDLDRDEAGRGEAYKTGDFSSQIRTLDRTMKGLESNLLSFTLWNYAAGNNNIRGDLWNDEDLSIFSRDQQTVDSFKEDLNNGGRALQSVIRPYPMKTSGIPRKLSFAPLESTRRFHFEFSSTAENDPKVAPSIIFVPNFQYPNGVNIEVSDGEYEYFRKDQYIKYVHSTETRMHSVTITHKLV